jgi:hypothetical protein
MISAYELTTRQLGKSDFEVPYSTAHPKTPTAKCPQNPMQWSVVTAMPQPPHCTHILAHTSHILGSGQWAQVYYNPHTST